MPAPLMVVPAVGAVDELGQRNGAGCGRPRGPIGGSKCATSAVTGVGAEAGLETALSADLTYRYVDKHVRRQRVSNVSTRRGNDEMSYR